MKRLMIGLTCVALLFVFAGGASARLKLKDNAIKVPLAAGRNLLAAAVFNDAPGSTDLTLIVQIKLDGKIVLDEGHPCRVIIPTRDIPNDDDPTGWTRPEFDDSGWQAATYGVGYADDDDNTRVGDRDHAAVYTLGLSSTFSIPVRRAC
jgi:hypothetical protein